MKKGIKRFIPAFICLMLLVSEIGAGQTVYAAEEAQSFEKTVEETKSEDAQSAVSAPESLQEVTEVEAVSESLQEVPEVEEVPESLQEVTEVEAVSESVQEVTEVEEVSENVQEADEREESSDEMTVEMNSAEETLASGDFEYELDDDDNAKITAYKGSAASVTIPGTLDGHKVVSLENFIFDGNIHLQTVVIPDSVTYIGRRVFKDCTSLTSVTLSKGLKEICTSAFKDCDSLESIEIPKSLEKITSWTYDDNGVFYGCDKLSDIRFETGTTQVLYNLFANCPGITEVTIPDTVTKIGSSAFGDCVNLEKVVISDSVTLIERRAFWGCKSLSDVTMSKKLKEIYHGAFHDCDSLESIMIPKSLVTVSGTTYESPGVFSECDNLNNIIFENGVTVIGNGLFANCPGLTKMVIPETVTSIESHAFDGCANLAEITIPKYVTEIGGWAFRDCESLTAVEIPDKVKEIGRSAFENCTSLSKVTLSKGLTNIGYCGFKNCESLASVEIPKSLESTGTWQEFATTYRGIFQGCTSLKKVTFEEGTEKIAGNLFANCPGIEEITIPDTVKLIGGHAFYNCENLSKVTMSNAVEEIEGSVFRSCPELLEISLPDTLTQMGGSVFYQCTSLKKVKLSENCGKISASAFQDCTSLEEITIPDAVTVIDEYAFCHTGLTKIVIPDNVEKIWKYAFQNCGDLEEVTVGRKVERIAEYAFQKCSSLEKVVLNDQLTAIEKYVFQDCDALTEISIPDSVTSLGINVFDDCELLEDVKLGRGISTIPKEAFLACPSLESIVIPYYVTELEDSSFKNCTSLVSVTMPRGLAKIGTDVFSYPDKMTIYGISGTYAETYAKANGITFVAKDVPATKVTLPETLVLEKDQSRMLAMTVEPEDFTDEISWKSMDPDIVSVDEKGIVKGKATGSTTIKVFVGDVSASCAVTVSQLVKSISVKPDSKSIEAAQTFQVTASVSPSDAAIQTVTWSSSDEMVATVSEEGLVKTLSKGTANIVATAQDGSGVTGVCSLTVTNNAVFAKEIAELESPHPYENDCSDIWIYELENAEQLFVTFDENTKLEEGFDFLYLYDADGKEVGKYSGTELAGKTVTIPGSLVKIQIKSDEKGNEWGFKVTQIKDKQEGTEDDPTDDPDKPADDPDKPADDPDKPTDDPDKPADDPDKPADDPQEPQPPADDDISPDSPESFNTYRVKFDMRRHGEPIYDYVGVWKGSTIDEPEEPAEDGYIFGGWYKDYGCKTQWNFALDKVKSNTTLYAKWTEEEKPADAPHKSYIYLSSVKAKIGTIKGIVYNGEPQMPAVKVTAKINGKTVTLAEGKDYTTYYSDNIDAGKAEVTVEGRGAYAGSVNKTFTIKPKPIKNLTVVTGDAKIGDWSLPIYVFDGNKLLKKDWDYTVKAKSSLTNSAGRKTVTITKSYGSNYTGKLKVKINVFGASSSISEKDISFRDSKFDYDFTGGPVQPDVVVTVKGTVLDKSCYSVQYVNNIDVGNAIAIVSGQNGYGGTVEKTFRIRPAGVTLAVSGGIGDVQFDGTKQRPKVTVTSGGKVLTEGVDYRLAYKNNVHVSTADKMATITVRGIGNYVKAPLVTATFKITKQAIGGIDVKGKRDKLVVTYNKAPLVENVDYTLQYGSEVGNKVEAQITGIGDFTGTTVRYVKR